MNCLERYYEKTIEKSGQHRLTVLFRIASNELNSLKLAFAPEGPLASKDLFAKIEKLIDLHQNLKSTITDKPFSKGHSIDQNDENNAITAYEKLKNGLYDIKLVLM